MDRGEERGAGQEEKEEGRGDAGKGGQERQESEKKKKQVGVAWRGLGWKAQEDGRGETWFQRGPRGSGERERRGEDGEEDERAAGGRLNMNAKTKSARKKARKKRKISAK